MRVGRGLLAALAVLVVFAAGYLVGRGQRPGVQLPALPEAAPPCPPVEPEVFGPEQVPAFADTMDRLLEDLDRRVDELRRRPGNEPAGFEHAYRYYGQVRDGLRALAGLEDPDSIAEARRRVVLSYRAALKVLQVVGGD